jgi:hypothetical protein
MSTIRCFPACGQATALKGESRQLARPAVAWLLVIVLVAASALIGPFQTAPAAAAGVPAATDPPWSSDDFAAAITDWVNKKGGPITGAHDVRLADFMEMLQEGVETGPRQSRVLAGQ